MRRAHIVPVGRAEHGSLPLTMLTALILAGVVVTVGISITTGVNTARHDRDFNASIQIADAGVQQAYTQIAQLTAEQDELDPTDPELLSAGSVVEGSGELDGETFAWAATFDGSGVWSVVSKGGRGETERTLVADIGARNLFPLSLYADVSMQFNGLPSGTARAYNAAGQQVNMTHLLGSAGPITLNGQCRTGVVLFDEATINRSCDPTPQPGVAPDVDADFAKDAFEGGVCASGTNNAQFQADLAAGALLRGRDYCVSGVTIGNGQRIAVVAPPADLGLDGTAPARIYVEPSGDFSFSSGNTKLLNPGVASGTPNPPGSAPESTALEVFMSGGNFNLRSNSHFAGVLWAPTTACNASNGNTYSYGALVCGTFNNNGNWTHWYDTEAGEITDGLLTVNSYGEDPSATL